MDHMVLILSNFPYVDVEQPDPDSSRMKEIIVWLTQFFQLDPQIYSVKMQCLWTCTFKPVCQQLKVVSRIEKWLHWLNWCQRQHAQFIMLVQPCSKEVCESNVIAHSSVNIEDDRSHEMEREVST